MQYLTNRLLVQYLLFLALIFIVCVGLIVSVHTYVRNLDASNKSQEAQINNHIAHIRALDADIYALQSHFYSITASTVNSSDRESVSLKIDKHFNSANSLISKLDYAPCLEEATSKGELISNLPKLMDELKDKIKITMELATLRDDYLEGGNKNLPHIAYQIRSINANIPKLFDKIHNLTEPLINESLSTRATLQNENNRLQKKHGIFEWLALLVFGGVFIGVLYLSFRQLIRLYKQLETQLKIDPLTHLPNRFALITESHRCKIPLISIVNINSFRTINELYGVDAGNEVLIKLADFLRKFAKQKRLELFRISGDEFAFLHCQNGLHVDEFTSLMINLCEMVNSHKFTIKSIDGHIQISVSCGISSDVLNPLGKADMALHRAKSGHENVAIYNQSLDSEEMLKTHHSWIEKIQFGIENNSFLPHFQPIVSKEGNVVYYEALMRLAITEGEDGINYYPPIHFLNLAHKTKCYPAISKMTLLKSFEIANKFKIPISVNLCYKDILNQSLKETLLEAISTMKIGPLLTFEIIETEDIKNYETISAFMKDFRPLGVQLALDDFGSGFSNFSHIPSLKPDIIKIDGSLVKELDTSPYACAMVKAICTLCKELGILSVAEYIHNEAVFEKAQELGVKYFQGYYFSPPTGDLKPKDFCFNPKASSSE